ncbi:hypothetical protein Tco_1038979 [Tanacetum coccineum]
MKNLSKKAKEKSTSKPATGIVIREPHMETKLKRKEKEKVDAAHRKGIELLSEVALSEKAQMKEVRKKSLRDFHKTHPSSSGMVFEKPPSVEKITPTIISKGTGDKPGVPDVTNDDSSESESESWINDEDDSNNEQESSDESSKQENESEEQESDLEQDKESNDDDQEKEEFDQENESEDDEMKNAHVTISAIPKKTEVPITSSSRSSDLASKFLKFSDIPQTDAEIVSPLDVHEVSNFAPPVIEKLIKESRDEVTLAKVSSQPQSTYEASSTLTEFELKKILLDKMEKSESYLMAPEHRDCYDGLKKSYALDKDFFYSYDVYSLKRGQKYKDTDKDPSARSDRGLKKRKTSKDAEPTTSPKKKDSTSGSSKCTKSQPKSTGKFVQSEEPVFEVADSDMPQDQEGNLGDNEDEPKNETASKRDWFKKPKPPQEPTDPDWNVGKTTKEGPAFRLLKGTHTNYAKLKNDFEECYKALSKKLDWENPKGGDYPFDLSKPLPLITRRNRQRVPFEFFINNDLKYLQGGISTMIYTTFTTKTKTAQYDLPGIEDMVPNIWSPVKIAYDKYALWGISHWREQLRHVSVRMKHRYGYLEEIVVRRADNILYRFKEGDDVVDFAIALRMFTRSLVIQKRVEDLQLGVESYQKKINVTKPDTTRPDLRKSYGTLTRLLSSLEDITKNIEMEYLPKRRWSTLEKKRAHFMIKDINKLLKERRMMRSLAKFVGGRLYKTDLKLLQRTI